MSSGNHIFFQDFQVQGQSSKDKGHGGKRSTHAHLSLMGRQHTEIGQSSINTVDTVLATQLFIDRCTVGRTDSSGGGD